MAEAIVNHDLGDTWIAFSAGTRATGFVHPMTRAVLAEIGIRHQGRSKSVDEFRQADFEIVVTVCDSAAEECPVWLGKGTRLHMDFPDPALAAGAEAEVMDAFRTVRDDIRRRIVAALQSISTG
jgi:arsenate reductase